MENIKKAVIPAAGMGKRMKTLSRYLPKPMLPLGKRPVLHHIIGELKEAGIEEIAVIIRTEYESIVEYFGDMDGLTFITDDTASGPGGALLKAKSFVEGEKFAVAFSDAPMRGKGRSDYLRNLMSLKEEEESKAVLSVYEVPPSEVSARGIVVFEEENVCGGEVIKLSDIVEKPNPNRHLGRWAAACRYILDGDIFEILTNLDRDTAGELQLTAALRYLIRNGEPVLGYTLFHSLKRYDTGNFAGYFEAFEDFADASRVL